jgi:hypothetical protein
MTKKSKKHNFRDRARTRGACAAGAGAITERHMDIMTIHA